MGARHGKQDTRKRGQWADRPSPEAEPPSCERPRTRLTRRRKWIFRVVAAVVVPTLCLLLPELGLRLLGYGYPTGFFVEIERRRAYTTNQKFGWRFFPPAIARTPVACDLPADKGTGTYRIFVLGGSAAQGMPDSAFSFGRILQVMLEEQYPGAKFEVINTAMTAINSHVVLTIARQCAEREPDLFIIYMGNNEVVGPYGAGTVFQGYSPSRFMIRASIAARATKLGQLVANVAGQLAGPAENLTEWRGMEMFLGHRVAADDPRLTKVYSHFRENLADICETAHAAGARTILCTVASNLKDNAPFASLHRPDLTDAERTQWETIYQAGIEREAAGEPAEAVAQYLEAARIDDRFAELHFRLGRCLLALAEPGRAREHYLLARELDALRFRADTQVNRIIREIGAAKASEDVHLVDAVRAFERSDKTPHEIPGDELFFEHVHINFDGNYLLAEAVFEKLAGLAPDGFGDRASNPLPPPDRCARHLALTAWNRYQNAKAMFDATSCSPFVDQLDHQQKRAARRQHLHELKRQATAPQALDEARRIYREAIARRPGDLPIRENFASMLQELGDYDGAARQWRFLVQRVPGLADWHTGLGVSLVGQGETAAGIEQFQRVAQFMPGLALAHYHLGAAFAKQGNLDEAARHYHRALQINPDHEEAHYNLANALMRQEKLDEAIDHYQQALRIKPDYNQAHNNLGAALLRKGKTPEALQHFRQAVQIDPDHTEARNNLAKVLLEQGDLAGAIDQYQHLVRVDPTSVKARNSLAAALIKQGNIAQAVEQFRELIRLEPDSLSTVLSLAQILATHHDPRLRNGPEAVRLAQRACRQTGYKNPAILDLLAAAYAEAGQFDQARSTAQKAYDLAMAAGKQQLSRAIRRRLELYKQGKPFHQPPGGRKLEVRSKK